MTAAPAVNEFRDVTCPFCGLTCDDLTVAEAGDRLAVRENGCPIAVAAFAREGGLVLGICNGFQVLCEARLLPGALLPNATLKFVFRQVALEVVHSDSPFTRACARGERLSIPIKHTTGCFYAPEPELDRLESEGQVLLRYAPGENPNGSLRDIAGVCNAQRNVFGLMPHPEHAVDPLTGSTDGLKLLDSIRAAVADRVVV